MAEHVGAEFGFAAAAAAAVATVKFHQFELRIRR